MPQFSLAIPDKPYRAYLFDLDGTVADSMPLHWRAWSQAITEFGGHFPEELFYAWGGIPLVKTVEMLNERFGYSMSPVETVKRKEALYHEIIHELQPVASVIEHVEAQHGRIPLAIVAGSPCASIHSTLTQLGLLDRFQVIIGSEDYQHGKPDPEPFLTAAARLNVPPADCLVFEDAEAGIAAAQAAGMDWVRVPVRPLPI
jgi:beta-phosphoglucomutase family hydrolase